MLVRAQGPQTQGLHYYEDTRAPSSIFDSIDAKPGWYLDLNKSREVRYLTDTRQYELTGGLWWDPVHDREFTKQGDWYAATDQSGDYGYNGTHYRSRIDITKEWLAENFADTRSKAVQMIGMERWSDRNKAWELLDNWNLAYPNQPITPEQVELKAADRARDLAEAQQPAQPQVQAPKFTSRSYRLRDKPQSGLPIDLPSDQEVQDNTDFYWRGRGDEMGGGAAERKEEKHGFDPLAGYRFARQNRARWFAERGTNHIIFHNYPNPGGVVHMAVWDWTTGQMVTYYDIEPRLVGDVSQYLKDKGM